MNMNLYSSTFDVSRLNMKETPAVGLYSLSSQQRAAGIGAWSPSTNAAKHGGCRVTSDERTSEG